MSRYIEQLRNGVYVESLCAEDECRWLINDVCCNADCKDMLADFPDAEYCHRCRYFQAETDADLEKLKDCIVTKPRDFPNGVDAATMCDTCEEGLDKRCPHALGRNYNAWGEGIEPPEWCPQNCEELPF